MMLKATNIHKSYKIGQTTLNVLKGVDIQIAKGEFVAIIGASGSGKSTLLHILGGLDKPDTGIIEFQGRDISLYSGRKLNKYRNKKVGFVFQFYHLLDELSVIENIMMPAMASRSLLGWLANAKSYKNRAKNLLELMGLGDRYNQKSYQLSGGERQRVAIARALMNQPDVLLADEPTGNLDTDTGNGILRVFEKLNESGQSIAMVTHDNRIAQKADRVVKLIDGSIEHAAKGGLKI